MTEGVFSMEASIVDLNKILELAKRYDAIVFLDDCHGAGIIGDTGRGTPEHCGLTASDVDIYMATMAKGLSGGGGGYLTGKSKIISYMK